MYSGSTIISSILKALEDTLLAFQDLALGTAPVIRHFFPGGPGRNPVLGVSLGRVIDVMAFKTDPPGILIIGRHFPFNSFHRKTYQSGFSCRDMNTFLGANLFVIHLSPCSKKPAVHRAGLRAGARGFSPQA